MGRAKGGVSDQFQDVLGIRRGRTRASVVEAARDWQKQYALYADGFIGQKPSATDALTIMRESYQALKDLQAALLREEGRSFQPEDITFTPANSSWLNERAVVFFDVYLGSMGLSGGQDPSFRSHTRSYEFRPCPQEPRLASYTSGHLLLFEGEPENFSIPLVTRPQGEDFSKREMAEARKEVRAEIVRRLEKRLVEGPASLPCA